LRVAANFNLFIAVLLCILGGQSLLLPNEMVNRSDSNVNCILVLAQRE
jgi:hypothetical protein